MAAIADLSDLINRATGGNSGTPENVFFFKANRVAGAAATAPIAGRLASLWTYDGYPAGGAVPGAVAVPTNATVGALPFTDPGGGRQKWMTNCWCVASQPGTMMLYDRLLHIGGLVGNVNTAQTVGGTLTRNTVGVGNVIIVEIYTIIGTTATTITASYSNTVPTSGRTTTAVAIGATNFREVTRAFILPLQSGDQGVSAVASITLAATTGTAGSIGVSIARPIAYIPAPQQGICGFRDFTTGLPGIPEIETDACLSMLWIPQGAAAPELYGGYSMVEA